MYCVKGREYLSDGITVNMLELRLLMGKEVLSLRSGGGDTSHLLFFDNFTTRC